MRNGEKVLACKIIIKKGAKTEMQADTHRKSGY